MYHRPLPWIVRNPIGVTPCKDSTALSRKPRLVSCKESTVICRVLSIAIVSCLGCQASEFSARGIRSDVLADAGLMNRSDSGAADGGVGDGGSDNDGGRADGGAACPSVVDGCVDCDPQVDCDGGLIFCRRFTAADGFFVSHRAVRPCQDSEVRGIEVYGDCLDGQQIKYCVHRLDFDRDAGVRPMLEVFAPLGSPVERSWVGARASLTFEVGSIACEQALAPEVCVTHSPGINVLLIDGGVRIWSFAAPSWPPADSVSALGLLFDAFGSAWLDAGVPAPRIPRAFDR